MVCASIVTVFFCLHFALPFTVPVCIISEDEGRKEGKSGLISEKKM